MRPFTLLGIALALGLLAAILAAQFAGFVGGDASKPVVVAARSIEAGVQVEAGALKIVNWPEGSLPPGAISSAREVVGRYARQAIVEGEPILQARLSPVQSRGGLASYIAPGKRAISVKVNEVVAVAGFALPGSFVDVLVSAKDANEQPFSKTVLQHIKVLAIAQDTEGDPNTPKVVNAVTLELTPEEAERLDLARNVGTLSLALRNEFDRDAPASIGVRVGDLLSDIPQASSQGPIVMASGAAVAAQNNAGATGSKAPVANAAAKDAPARAPARPAVRSYGRSGGGMQVIEMRGLEGEY